MSMKNSIDTIGNRTRALPASSAVPQLTAPTRVPLEILHWNIQARKLLFYVEENTVSLVDRKKDTVGN